MLPRLCQLLTPSREKLVLPFLALLMGECSAGLWGLKGEAVVAAGVGGWP